MNSSNGFWFDSKKPHNYFEWISYMNLRSPFRKYCHCEVIYCECYFHWRADRSNVNSLIISKCRFHFRTWNSSRFNSAPMHGYKRTIIITIHIIWYVHISWVNIVYWGFQTVFFNSGQKMALRAFYLQEKIINVYIYYIKGSQRYLLAGVENNGLEVMNR